MGAGATGKPGWNEAADLARDRGDYDWVDAQPDSGAQRPAATRAARAMALPNQSTYQSSNRLNIERVLLDLLVTKRRTCLSEECRVERRELSP